MKACKLKDNIFNMKVIFINKWIVPAILLLLIVSDYASSEPRNRDTDKMRISSFIHSEGLYSIKGKSYSITIKSGENNDVATTKNLESYIKAALALEGARYVSDEMKADYELILEYSYFLSDGLSKAPRLRSAHKFEEMAHKTYSPNGVLMSHPYSPMKETPYTDMGAKFEQSKASWKQFNSSKPEALKNSKSRRELIVSLKIKEHGSNFPRNSMLVIVSTSNRSEVDMLPPFASYLMINKFGHCYKKWENFRQPMQDSDFLSFIDYANSLS